MNPMQFFKHSRLVPTMLCAASFLAGLQLAETGVIDTDNAVFRSFRDAYQALYEVSAGTTGPVTYYVVSTDPEALEQRVSTESGLVSMSPTVFDQVYAVEVAREDTAALERLREAPEVMAALRFLFFCH